MLGRHIVIKIGDQRGPRLQLKTPFNKREDVLDTGNIKPFASIEASAQAIMRDLEKSMEIKENPAKWTFRVLTEYIKNFETTLDQEHEIGARLVSFGRDIMFHIRDISYYYPNMITFYGINENGENVQLIQNYTQLSVLLIAVKRIEEKARRIGFLHDEEGKK